MEALLARIRALADGAGSRVLVALAGAPGAGKSTLAADLAAALGPVAAVVPMDGYHLDNAILDARGRRFAKGSPDTFDVAGFAAMLRRLKAEDEVIIPVFDRDIDLSRGSARLIGPEVRIAVVEGNYLLLRDPPWNSLTGLWDLTVFLDVPEAELERRLVARWLHHGLGPAAARHRAEANDLPNARLVVARSAPPDLVLGEGSLGAPADQKNRMLDTDQG
jgi:pantothenate kinase